MTMTLEEVNHIRFPMAHRPNEGYRAQEVDEFVDRVVETMQSMSDDSVRLKAQLEGLKADNAQAGNSQPGQAEADQALKAENQRLQAEVEDLRGTLDRARSESSEPVAANQELDRLRQHNQQLQQRAADLDRQLTEARMQADQARAEAQAPRPGQEATQLGSVDPSAAAGQQVHGTGKLEKIVVTTSAEASPAVIRLVQLATEQAEGVVRDAERDAEQVRGQASTDAAKTREEADAYAADTTKAADESAQQTGADAKGRADKLLSQARAQADQVEVDAKNRRGELFAALEAERDVFVGKVDQLKAWEARYRSGMTAHLRQQAEALDADTFEPGDAATLLGDERTSSATPRLDALLAQKQ